MSEPVAWWLNLDADHELRKPLGYLPNKKVLARVQQMRGRIRDLVRLGDVLLERNLDEAAPKGLRGRCWCPTPTALAALSARGAKVGDVPAFDIVQRVNHRLFCVELGLGLRGSGFVDDEAELRRRIGAGSPTGKWVMKRPFSIAGSGRRVLRRGCLEAHDEPWVRASMRQGVVLEPWVEKDGEVVLHGFISRDGEVTLGDVCVQDVDDWGSWLDTGREDAQFTDHDLAGMRRAGAEVAEALRRAGYFGPFGIDAFHHVFDGVRLLNAVSEVNARYTMGWAIGMGGRRPDVGE